MKEKIEKFEGKYETQEKLLDSWLLRDLNESKIKIFDGAIVISLFGIVYIIIRKRKKNR